MNTTPVTHSKYRFTIRMGILAVFFSIIFVIACLLLGLISWRFYTNSKYHSDRLTQALSTSVVKAVNNHLSTSKVASELSAKLIQSQTISRTTIPQLLQITGHVLEALPQAQMAYFGDEEGNFVITRREKAGHVSAEVIQLKPSLLHYKLLRNAKGRVLSRQDLLKVHYDPRQRPWYQLAKAAKTSVWSAPYQFFTGSNGQGVGITRATPIHEGKKFIGVFGVDITLSALSQFLESIVISQKGLAFIVDSNDHLIAYPHQRDGLQSMENIDHPWVKEAHRIYKANPAKTTFNYHYQKEQYHTSVYSVPGFATTRWLIFIIVPSSDIMGPIIRANMMTLGLCVSLLILGFALVSILAGHITRPIKALTDDLENIKEFILTTNPVTESRLKEVYHMAQVIAAMKNGLRAFQQYIPEGLVRTLIQTGRAARIGGGRRKVTTLFTDIENFTAVSETISDEAVMTQMCEYFDTLSQIVVENKGTIDKYIGDSLMAFWGAPEEDEQQVYHACLTLLKIQSALKQLNRRWVSEAKQPFYTRFGLNFGDAIVGNLGSKNRLNYTAIGDNVNLASRLEHINKVYGTQLMVSESVYQATRDKFIFRVLDKISVKGQKKALYIYELIADKTSENHAEHQAYCDRYATGMALYQQREWHAAAIHYQGLIQDYPTDQVAQIMQKRCRALLQENPGAKWNGVWTYQQK